MAYTPELSQEGSATLRRLAWFLGKPMTETLEMVIEVLSVSIAETNPGGVCATCRDPSKCETCAFNPDKATEKSAAEGS